MQGPFVPLPPLPSGQRLTLEITPRVSVRLSEPEKARKKGRTVPQAWALGKKAAKKGRDRHISAARRQLRAANVTPLRQERLDAASS